jgi:murein DD-endopeptidase MepM/ murein hydrolase activator NlpD
MTCTPRIAGAVLVTFALAAASAAAAKPPAKIVFPLVGAAVYTDDFGEARSQGGHEGNDILAARRAPAVATEAGTVRFWTTSWQAGCMLYLYGESGTMYLYVHLNNDLGTRNDNRGTCVPGVAYAPGLKDGQAVAAGQLVGFVGDSGDADGLHPHLHFELHPNGGAAVSPYRLLRRAEHLTEPTPAPGTVTAPTAATALTAATRSPQARL